MIVVSDTSPLNYLILIGQTEVLSSLFDRIVIPPAVLNELEHSQSPELVSEWAASPPVWLEIVTPTAIDETLPLGRGEMEAISLAQEIKADTLLIDERKGSIIARKLGLTVTGTLGVLALAAERGLLDLPQAIAALRQTNFREPADVIELLLQHDAQRRSQDR
jgi:predicted nucleic acid-binding protein